MLFLCIYKKENIREINWIRYFQSSLRILFFGIYLRLRIINGHVSSHTYNLSWRFLRKSFFTIYPVILLLRLYCLISPESDNGIFLDKTGIPISSPKWSLKYLSIESSVQFSSFAQSCLFATPWTTAHQPSLSITKSWSLLRFVSTESVMPSNHLILGDPLVLLPSIFASIGVFSNELALHFRWPKYCSLSFSISPSTEYSGFISFAMYWFGLLAVQESSPAPQFKGISSSVLSLLWTSLVAQMVDSTCSAADMGSIPGLGRSPGEGNGKPLQYSCLKNSMDRGAWRAAVHGVEKSWTRLYDYHFHRLPYDPPLVSVHDYWKNHSFDYTTLCQQSDVSVF